MLELASSSDRTLYVAPRHVGPAENNDPRHTRIVLVNNEALEVKGNFRVVAQKLSESLGETIVRGPH